MKLVTRPQFYLDVAAEVEYLATKAGAATARRWSESVRETVRELRRQPELGRLRGDLQPPGIRSWRVQRFPRWLIFYAVQPGALVLLRVRYGSMDLPALEFPI